MGTISKQSNEKLYNHLAGVLLGTALGDALGLYMEGLSAKTIAYRFPSGLARYHLLGDTGFVSDDTEQSALLAQSLVRHPADSSLCTRSFQKAMSGWFCRLPFGIGRATSFACLRMLTGMPETGMRSAGNGAAMRAAIIGVFFHDDQKKRLEFGTGLARTTHIDARAVEGALFVAEMAAALFNSRQAQDENSQIKNERKAETETEEEEQQQESIRYYAFEEAMKVVQESSLRAALLKAFTLAARQATVAEAQIELGSSGFVNQSVPLAVFAFLRFRENCLTSIQSAIKAGGDTDTNAAIVGAWCGALYGEEKLSQELIGKIHDGPFGPSHLRQLARALVSAKEGNETAAPGYSWPLALCRNIALLPLILSHALLRLAQR